MTIPWNPSTHTKFLQMIDKVPVFLRDIARDKVSKRAETFMRESGLNEISDKELVDAFFKETPFGFHGPMKTDMLSIGIDYTQFGYEK